jgi:membrane protease subunit (stomatin/prohibitin family)
MGVDNIVFLEVIEWLDQTGQEIVHRIPENGSGEIKFGAQLTVRESQAAVMFYQGRAGDAFGAGRHILKTANIPILTKIVSVPWGMTSPLRAEVYFVNMKVFADLKWGTRDPVAFKDSELGLVRLRAFGTFNVQVVQPVLLINSLVGTVGKFTTAEIEDYLRSVIVSRFNDHLGENLDSVLSLPGRYDDISNGLQQRLLDDFKRFGLHLQNLYITSITPPPEVQEAIDDRGRLAVLKDLDGLVKMKAAMAMEKAAESGGAAGSGLGVGMGLMMPGLFSDIARSRTGASGGTAPASEQMECPDCHNPVAAESVFCPLCGHQIVVLRQCPNCGKNLTLSAKFCSRCGRRADEKPAAQPCPNCRFENLPGATFCNQCGEKLV